MSITRPIDSGHQSLSVFNPEKLLRHLEGRHQRSLEVMSVVERILRDGTQALDQAKQALHRQQAHQAIHLLHTLRGSVMNLGASRVCILAESLEHDIESRSANNNSLNDSEIEHLFTLFSKLETELKQFLQEAEQWFKQQNQRLKQSAPYPLPVDEPHLSLFIECLKDHNLKSCDLFEEMSEGLRQLIPVDDYEKLVDCVSQLKFHEAHSLMVLLQSNQALQTKPE